MSSPASGWDTSVGAVDAADAASDADDKLSLVELEVMAPSKKAVVKARKAS